VEKRWHLRPYYMVTRKQHPPTGMWAVRFKADLPPGKHKITIRTSLVRTAPGVEVPAPAPVEGDPGWFRGSNMPRPIEYEFEVVDLPVPAADIAFGVYYQLKRVYPEYRTPKFQEMYIRDMAEHGMTSVTIFDSGSSARDHQDTLNRYIPLLKKYDMDRFPVIVSSDGPGLVPEKDGVRLMLYGPDEPNHEQPSVVAQCKASREKADRLGMMHVTALGGETAWFIGELFDVWIVLHNTLSEALVEHGRKLNSEVWMYDCTLRGTNPQLHRWFFGVYAWSMRVKGCFRWGWTHYADSCIKPDGTWNGLMFYDYVLPTADGPMPTVGWEGAREGILDYRLLKAVEQKANDEQTSADIRTHITSWLNMLRRSTPPRSWLGGDYWYDKQDTYDPGVNLDEVRRKAVEFLQR